MSTFYVRAITGISLAASITGGVGLGAFAWEVRRPQSGFQTFRNMTAAIAMGALAGLVAGPGFFPLLALVCDADCKDDDWWKMIERNDKMLVLEAREQPKDFFIRYMNAGRRSRGLKPRFEDPPALERITVRRQSPAKDLIVDDE